LISILNSIVVVVVNVKKMILSRFFNEEKNPMLIYYFHFSDEPLPHICSPRLFEISPNHPTIAAPVNQIFSTVREIGDGYIRLNARLHELIGSCQISL